MNQKIIVRYPPSPSGEIHIGNIRTFLFNYLFAKQNGGEIVLRFEDTDLKRSEKKYEELALETLSELGISFDRGPFRQSDRSEFYREALERMLEKDLAYEGEESKNSSGEKVIRFRNPNRKVSFKDRIRGEISIDSTDFGDFVIARSITEPLYHLTVVVDDIDMAVSHIIRGEDHITSTPRQILLIEALGGDIPEYTHLPFIVAENKKKLGKRDGAISWSEFRKMGYLPEGLVNYLALLGWNPGGGSQQEIFSREELIGKFSLDQVNKNPATFSFDKLNDINRQWILKLDEESFFKKVLEFLPNSLRRKFDSEEGKRIGRLVIRERISRFDELSEMAESGEFSYYFEEAKISLGKALFRDETEEKTRKVLLEMVEKISEIPEKDWHTEKIKECLWDWSAEVGRGAVLHPFRTLLSGAKKSPDPFVISEILGKEETLKRLQKHLK